MSAFDKVIGYESIKSQLINYCDCITNPEKYKRIGVKIPKGVLLEGQPGMGKTLMAKCFIEESKRISYTIRRNASDEDFIREVRKTFEEAAKNEPSIILLDDMDKYANEDSEHKDAAEYVAIQALIDEYSSYDIFFIATVNDKELLPSSLIRPGRFDASIYFYAPKIKDATKIISYYLKKQPISNDVDMELISKIMLGNSCAELEKVINEAGIFAAYKGYEKVDQQSFLYACLKHEYRDDCMMIDELSENNKNDMKTVAVHEIGHALVSEVLDPGSVSMVSILKNNYREIDGFTKIREKDDHTSHKFLVQEILVKLAGKAALEVVLGIVDTGCRSDIRSADYDIERLVGEFSQYGFYTGWEYDDSPWCDKNRHRLVAFEMERYYQIAKRIISQNRVLFDAMELELEKKKILSFRNIEQIIKEQGIKLIKPEMCF